MNASRCVQTETGLDAGKKTASIVSCTVQESEAQTRHGITDLGDYDRQHSIASARFTKD